MRSVNRPQFMKKSLIDIICATYESTARNAALIEKIVSTSGRVFSLRMGVADGRASFELRVDANDPEQLPEAPIVVSNGSMMSAVVNGQSFIRFLLTSLNEQVLLNEIAGNALSIDSPNSMGGTIKSEWGTVSLLLPDGSNGYRLETRIVIPGRLRIKQRDPINPSIVADAVQAGDIPLFAALRSSPAAAHLLAQHDKFLRSVIEADALAKASAPSADAPAPRRPRTL